MMAAARVFDLSVGQMLWSRRTVFLALVVGSPSCWPSCCGWSKPRVQRGADGRRARRLGRVDLRPVHVGALPALHRAGAGVFYGTSLIADEVDDKTITYLFTRPISRGAVLVGKYLGVPRRDRLRRAAVGDDRLRAARAARRSGLAATFPDLVKDLGLLALGLAVYGRSLPGLARSSSIRSSSGWCSPSGGSRRSWSCPGISGSSPSPTTCRVSCRTPCRQDSALSMLQSVFRDSPSIVVCLVMLLVFSRGSSSSRRGQSSGGSTCSSNKAEGGRRHVEGPGRSGLRAGLRTPGTLLAVGRFPALRSGLARSAVDRPRRAAPGKPPDALGRVPVRVRGVLRTARPPLRPGSFR